VRQFEYREENQWSLLLLLPSSFGVEFQIVTRQNGVERLFCLIFFLSSVEIPPIKLG